MSEGKLNAALMTVDKVVSVLSDAYVSVLEKGLPAKAFPSVMLWGAPGVGKSQAVRQIADEITYRTGKKVVVTDVRLLLFNPIDLRGIPTANEDKTEAVWLRPQIFRMDGGKNVVNILFLDEISAAPPSVQAAAYQIALDRTVGEHRLPDNCIVLAAGNRLTDKSVAYKMPKALANRFLHIEVEPSFSSWKKWAIGAGIHPTVVSFLSFRRNYLIDESPLSEAVAYPTPRSWEMVSDVLNNVSDDVSVVYDLIAGLVGSGIAVEYRTYLKIFSTLPDVAEIFRGREPTAPKSNDAVYALVEAMTSYARAHKTDYTAIDHSIRYASRYLSPDFCAVLLRNYTYLEKDYVKKLLQMESYRRWMSVHGKLLNGAV
ncbi:MAG: AAA family ATPase [Clostridia bacterium]|nr:AAA family ATPase [Clostridia bacterium]